MKIFIDTNLIIYLYSEDEPEKKQAVLKYIQSNYSPVISIQVINELSNVLYKKFKLNPKEVLEVIEELEEYLDTVTIDLNTIKSAHFIKEKYKYSYFDSLIIVSAIENKCEILLTEDMQHNQIIENKLRIINPFKD